VSRGFSTIQHKRRTFGLGAFSTGIPGIFGVEVGRALLTVGGSSPADFEVHPGSYVVTMDSSQHLRNALHG